MLELTLIHKSNCNICCITFPNNVKILYDPNVWNADLGNTADNTGHKVGIKVTRKGSADDATIIGDGKAIKAEVVGKLRGAICNKLDKEVQPAALNNVKYVPDACFNLFSLTQRMQAGWILSGDKDSMKLTSPDGKQNVAFDIKVNTLKESYILHVYEVSYARGCHCKCADACKDEHYPGSCQVWSLQ